MTALTLAGETRIGNLSFAFDLSVKAGETLAILGPNGAGKTSLLRVISGLLPLAEGTLNLNNQVADQPASKTFLPPHLRSVGWVPQDRLLFPHLTVAENIGFSPRATDALVAQLLEALNLTSLTASKPAACSGGQAQRVAVARALAAQPAILLLDEPSTALDAESQELIHGVLASQSQVATLLVTHDLSEAGRLADRTAIFSAGVLKQ
ncbi:MAG: ATP-binding cassette domain-containing protein [Actinobacteria bacterium]|jgi:molybdate transport system ATP-binding protein|nr:ATP-binding cassette domain-containing protein [Actinomycetota bacterium]MBT3746729.1 ATP-binding cassette domain-containing protein [Actinomycetota bacterium]MBT3969325.1 ATP-binding cassette domain-containing protein [Actinomycetota bacterium]MBT4009790.1 ATP-binding cassette domain-containing protein [Actinomycetota bacterium]MBT4303616.1 ATP-binding cassette domain-containing protein [Actinomycetota bacterium]